MKRCLRCVLPETIPNIRFDSAGICHYCRDFEKTLDQFNLAFEKNEEKFFSLVKEKSEKRKKIGGKYDVLVPLSGGRDSSYITYTLATKYNLKVLCVNYTNPFSSQQAKENIKNLVKKIKADLITFNYPRHIHEKTCAVNLKAWLAKPDLGMLGLICIACKPIYFDIFKIAKKNKVELIVEGANIFEVTTFKMEAQAGPGNKKLLSLGPIVKMLKKIIKNYRYLHFCNIYPAMRTSLSLFGSTPYLRWRYPGTVKTGYFYSFRYDEKEINKTLKEIGWEKAEDNNSAWRFDCEVDSVKNYIYNLMVGATEKDDLFSKNIRAGLMTREEALLRLNTEGCVNVDIVRRVLSKIGLKIEDIDSCLKENRK